MSNAWISWYRKPTNSSLKMCKYSASHSIYEWTAHNRAVSLHLSRLLHWRRAFYQNNWHRLRQPSDCNVWSSAIEFLPITSNATILRVLKMRQPIVSTCKSNDLISWILQLSEWMLLSCLQKASETHHCSLLTANWSMIFGNFDWEIMSTSKAADILVTFLHAMMTGNLLQVRKRTNCLNFMRSNVGLNIAWMFIENEVPKICKYWKTWSYWKDAEEEKVEEIKISKGRRSHIWKLNRIATFRPKQNA